MGTYILPTIQVYGYAYIHMKPWPVLA
jgi:hypothetical protein